MNSLFTDFAIKSYISIGISWIVFLIWWVDYTIYALIALFVIDRITGISKSIYKWVPIQSSKLKRTITKFILYSFAVIMWNMVDIAIIHDTSEWLCRNTIILYLSLTEAISIIENLAIMDVPLPKLITKYIQDKKDLFDKTNDNV